MAPLPLSLAGGGTGGRGILAPPPPGSRARDLSGGSADSNRTDPLLDSECAVEVAADFLDPEKADHSKVMLSDKMVRHICEQLSRGIIENIAPKLQYKTVRGVSVISWGNLWPHLFPARSRAHWIRYIKNLGVPESAINVAGVAGKAAASPVVLGALMYAGTIPPHTLVNVQPKVPTSEYAQGWPAAAT